MGFFSRSEHVSDMEGFFDRILTEIHVNAYTCNMQHAQRTLGEEVPVVGCTLGAGGWSKVIYLFSLAIGSFSRASGVEALFGWIVGGKLIWWGLGVVTCCVVFVQGGTQHCTEGLHLEYAPLSDSSEQVFWQRSSTVVERGSSLP